MEYFLLKYTPGIIEIVSVVILRLIRGALLVNTILSDNKRNFKRETKDIRLIQTLLYF